VSRVAHNVPAAVIDAVDRRDRRFDRLTGKGLGAGRNLHHRQLRSQGGKHVVENLITLSGSGTTGTHGLVHANVERATRYGFIVPGWVDDPARVPIRLATPRGRRWHYLNADGTVRPLHDVDAVYALLDLGIWTTDSPTRNDMTPGATTWRV
jgi:hypothetical protein